MKNFRLPCRGIFPGIFAIFLLPFALASAASAAAAPTIFFTDLQSGPNSGGENNNGTILTIYGKNFGTTPGTVTIGGGTAAHIYQWGALAPGGTGVQKISVGIGAAAKTGAVVVNVGGATSNSNNSFTVRAGNIYFVSTSGSDSAAGSFATPWQTIPKAGNTLAAGDIAYVMNGVVDNIDDGYGSPLNITSGGVAGKPIALVAYPGAVAQIGSASNQRGIIDYPPGGQNYWTIAGFKLIGGGTGEALALSGGESNWRLIGNDISCPTGAGSTGCITSQGTIFFWFLGNEIHDTGCPGSMATGPCGDTQKTYHAFYWGDLSGGTENHDVEVAWNDVHNIYGCRGIQFHSKDSTPGSEAYGLQVHDNLIYNVRCDAINVANVNPDKGAIAIYNNVMYHVGTGPDPSGQAANYVCINTNDSNGSPKANVEVYNNTCYDGGSRGASEGDAGAFSASIPTRYRNDIAQELSGEAYLTASTLSQCPGCVSGSTNIWFGVGTGPSQTTNNLNVDPKLVSPTSNFHLQSGSPAVDTGLAISGLTMDFDGISRPQGAAYDIGAYEFNQGTAPPPPPPPSSACDLNGDNSTNVADVQVCVNQVLGVVPCTNADLQNNGTCTAIDVQRVVNSALGQTCVVGP